LPVAARPLKCNGGAHQPNAAPPKTRRNRYSIGTTMTRIKTKDKDKDEDGLDDANTAPDDDSKDDDSKDDDKDDDDRKDDDDKGGKPVKTKS
jgi:hypothetical protein